MVIGGVATLVLAVAVVMALLRTGGAKAVSDNAGLIGALVALGGVFTAQMVSVALEEQRSHEAALRNYFEQVGKLLIEQPLLRASPGDKLSTVVRAQTLSVLDGLDPKRKIILLEFLLESGLIHKDKPVVSLVKANLGSADLNLADLSGANLSGANLAWANLRGATGITDEELEQRAYSLEGAIMPDGSKHP
jgi:pentapeptide repeat protein